MKQLINKYKSNNLLKFFLIFLNFTFFLNVLFINNETYVLTHKNKETTIFSKMEYKELLNKGTTNDILIMHQNIQLKYFNSLPKESILVVYLLYFVSICGIIIFYKKE